MIEIPLMLLSIGMIYLSIITVCLVVATHYCKNEIIFLHKKIEQLQTSLKESKHTHVELHALKKRELTDD